MVRNQKIHTIRFLYLLYVCHGFTAVSVCTFLLGHSIKRRATRIITQHNRQGSYNTFMFNWLRTSTEKDNWLHSAPVLIPSCIPEKKKWAQIQNCITIRNKELAQYNAVSRRALKPEMREHKLRSGVNTIQTMMKFDVNIMEVYNSNTNKMHTSILK